MRVSLTLAAIALFSVGTALAQDNTVTFDNQSGESAIVKLIGPTAKEIEVLAGQKGTVTAAAGRYYIKVRYGKQGSYRYAKGEEFDVTETATKRSEIAITLHKVANGNYESAPITEAEFGASSSTPSKKPETADSEKVVSAPGKSKEVPAAPADEASKKWPLVKCEELSEYAGVRPEPGKKFMKLYFANDGFILNMSFEDQEGKSLSVIATETTPKNASAVIQTDEGTKTVSYRLSKRTTPP
ncbi:MAG: hypothetical protein NT096_09290 [Proteobacteria bacterium]|nr:hypothetical protein [Pseudomonadota bacterium]